MTRQQLAAKLAAAFRPDPSGRPSARRCVVCGKPRGVTFHALQVGTQMRPIPSHLACFKRLRQTLT